MFKMQNRPTEFKGKSNKYKKHSNTDNKAPQMHSTDRQKMEITPPPNLNQEDKVNCQGQFSDKNKTSNIKLIPKYLSN